MKNLILLLAAAGTMMATPAWSQPGRLVIVGGALERDNAQVYDAFLDHVRTNEDARIAVISAASGSPASSAQTMVEVFAGYGIPADRVDIVRLAVRDDNSTPDVDESAWSGNASDPEEVAKITGAAAVWFTGGDQVRLTTTLLGAEGGDTPMLAALRARLEAGATLGGTSAGAAIMSSVMIERGDTITALLDPVLPGDASDEEMESGRLALGQGLGFFPSGLVDQHFEERARLGRLARALVESGTDQGFGIDENTGLIVDLSDRVLAVVGAGGVTWIDASEAEVDVDADRFGATGLRVSYLSGGDRLDLGSGALDVPGYKAPTIGNEYFVSAAPGGGGMALPPAGLPEIAGEALLDNAAADRVARISFRDNGDAVIYRFRQLDESEGYWGRDGEGIARYSMLRVGFDIVPAMVHITPAENR